MPFVAELQGFDKLDIIPSKVNRHPVISDEITQTLARLMGWYDAGTIWKRVNVDQQGRLLVSLAAGLTTQGNQSVVVVGLAAIRVLAANLNRREWFVQNSGGATIFLGLNSSVLAANGLILAPGAGYGNSSYVGEVWLIAQVVNGEARALEF